MHDSFPLVSILINNYNYDSFLADAINSALNQSYPHTEVIVVDDGSTDKSREVLAQYTGQVHTILKNNGGQASAFNAGFAACRGLIICLLDSDDFFCENKVEEIVKVYQSHSNIGWCFHGLSYVDKLGESCYMNDSEILNKQPTGIVDARDLLVLQGKIRFIAPATSALTFLRSTLDKIIPVPESIYITSDNYIKFSSLSLSPGYFFNAKLASQRLHGTNAYTGREDNRKKQLKANITLETAIELSRHFPEMRIFSNHLLAVGLALSLRNGGTLVLQKQEIRTYLQKAPFKQKINIFLRTFVHLIKS